MPRMLFLCYGNICRSPFAAAAMVLALPEVEGVSGLIASAGLFGPGRPANDEAIAAAARRGVDLRAHRSRLVTEELLLAVDCVFVMEPSQRADLSRSLGAATGPVLVLGDLDPCPIEQRKIPDPYGRDAEFFDVTYRRIERCTHAVASLLRDARR